MSADIFLQNIEIWLREGQYQQVKNVILDRNNVNKVKEHGMDIILGVCSHLNSEKTVWSAEMEECCEYSLLMVAQLSNPKEVLIALQEQVAEFGSSSKFKILLLPFQAVLLRLPDKNSTILNMVLESIGEHVGSLPLPNQNYLCFEGKERVLLDADPKVQCISDIYEALSEFYAPFVKLVALNRAPTKLDDEVCLRERRRVLKKNLLKTMEQPLISMDLHVAVGDSPNLLRRTAEKLVQHLSCVCGDVFSLPEVVHHFQLLEKSSPPKDDGNPPPSLQSLSTIFYLIYGEQFSSGVSVPCVYSPEYVFHTVLDHADLLLRSSQPLAVHKGLLLIEGLMKHVANSSLTVDCLDHPIHLQIFQSLIWLAVAGVNVREFKILSVKLWRPYLEKLHPSARYRLLRSLLPSVDHPGLKGCVINIIKDQIGLCLDNNWPYFVNDRLNELLLLIWKLPHDVETDLLEHMDPIMNGLNLARFLLLRDKDNASGFTKHLPAFEADFMEPITRALNLSRAHYQLELSKVCHGVSAMCNALLALPEMPLDQQKSVIETALNSFDLLESVLSRVNECLHSFNGIVSS